MEGFSLPVPNFGTSAAAPEDGNAYLLGSQDEGTLRVPEAISVRSPPMLQIVTANRLVDGDVVFRTADGHWLRDIDAAGVLADTAAAEAAHAAAQADVDAALVVDVALIDVAVEDGGIVPVRLRERIRAFGPTVKSDHRADLKPFAA